MSLTVTETNDVKCLSKVGSVLCHTAGQRGRREKGGGRPAAQQIDIDLNPKFGFPLLKLAEKAGVRCSRLDLR